MATTRITLKDVLEEVQKLREDITRVRRPDTLMTAFEAAEYLGVSVPTIRRWEKAGKIKTRGIGKGKRYTVEDLEVA